MGQDGPQGNRGPTVRGVTCVLLYTGAFVAVWAVGFMPLPRRVKRPLQDALLRPAAWTGERIDWAAHVWMNRVRRRLGTASLLRVITRALLDDAISETDEAAGYVGTIGPNAKDAVSWVERRLAEVGFHRNPTAFLEYRDRNGRQFEASSWVLRTSVTADHQLHVRLFDSRDGAVDLYGHREPSVGAGATHYGSPDYATGVKQARAVLMRANLPIERRSDKERSLGQTDPDTCITEVGSTGTLTRDGQEMCATSDEGTPAVSGSELR